MLKDRLTQLYQIDPSRNWEFSHKDPTDYQMFLFIFKKYSHDKRFDQEISTPSCHKLTKEKQAGRLVSSGVPKTPSSKRFTNVVMVPSLPSYTQLHFSPKKPYIHLVSSRCCVSKLVITFFYVCMRQNAARQWFQF